MLDGDIGAFVDGDIRAIVDDENNIRVAKYLKRSETWSSIYNLRPCSIERVLPFNLNLIMFLLTMTAAQDPTGIRDKL